jgi:hypothetical protein
MLQDAARSVSAFTSATRDEIGILSVQDLTSLMKMVLTG